MIYPSEFLFVQIYMDYLKDTIETYNKTVEKFKENSDSLMPKKEMGYFISLLPKGGRAVDIGCGFGRDCKFLKSKGFEVYGVDASKNMISKAQKHWDKSYTMDMRELRFDVKFDGIWCATALQHLSKKDVPDVLKSFCRILNKGGVLYINVKQGQGEKDIIDQRYGGLPKFYSY